MKPQSQAGPAAFEREIFSNNTNSHWHIIWGLEPLQNDVYGGLKFAGGGQLWAVEFNFGGFTTVLGILPTRYSCSPTAHKMDTSTGGPSQQPGPTPAALVLARSGGMPRVGALRLAASSAPTRPVPQLAIAARQEEEQSRLAIGPGPVHARARRADRVGALLLLTRDTTGSQRGARWTPTLHWRSHLSLATCLQLLAGSLSLPQAH